jgi:hypothetical protein
MLTDTIKTAKAKARIYMEADIPLFTEGPPGVGKSEMWQQLAKEKGIGFCDIRLAQMDPVDLRGLPTILKGQTVWTRPDFWPDEGWEGIMLFDELADCSRAMQSAAYQIILDRRAGPHILPKKAYPCAAGNRRKDKAAAQAVSTALASRFAWAEIEPDIETLLEYAVQNDWHYMVRGFLHHRPGLLHNMEGADLRAFPCPRQWERVSRICDAPRDLLLGLVSGLVGVGAAAEFQAFIKVAIDLPDLDEVIKAPKACRIPREPSGKYAMSAMLSQYLERKNVAAIMTYVGREEFGRDFEICTVLDAVKRDSSLMTTREFIGFANRNKDLRLG